MSEDVFIVQTDWYSPKLEALPFTSPFRVNSCVTLKTNIRFMKKYQLEQSNILLTVNECTLYLSEVHWNIHESMFLPEFYIP